MHVLRTEIGDKGVTLSGIAVVAQFSVLPRIKKQGLAKRVAYVNFAFCLHLQSQKQNIDINRQAKFAATPSLALFVNLKNVVCKIGEDAEVLMSLYDPAESKFIRSVTLPGCCLCLWLVLGKLLHSRHQVSLLNESPWGDQLARCPPAAGLVFLWGGVTAASLGFVWG